MLRTDFRRLNISIVVTSVLHAARAISAVLFSTRDKDELDRWLDSEMTECTGDCLQ